MEDLPIRHRLEFTDARDPRGKESLLSDAIDSDHPLPVPNVGELAYVEGKMLVVESRFFYYDFDGSSHVQLFCHEATQEELPRWV